MKKYTLGIMVALAGILAGLPSQGFSSVSLPYDQGFEASGLGSFSDANWNIASGGAIVTNTPIMSGLGSKALKLTNGTTAAMLQLNVTAGNSNVWFRFYTKPTGYDDAGGKPTNTSDNVCVFYVTTGGVIKAYNGTTWFTNLTVTLDTNRWTGFAVHMNYQHRNWDLYVSTNQTVNEEMVKVNSTPLGFCDGVAGSQLTAVKFSGEVVIDGISMTKAYSTNQASATSLQFETRYANQYEMGSVPLLSYSSPNNTLGGDLGRDLMVGMAANDRIRVFSTNGWNQYHLEVSGNVGTWQLDSGMPIADLTLQPGHGVMFYRQAGTDYLGFYPGQSLSGVSDLPMHGTNQVNKRGWNLCAWPYAVRQVNAGLGFTGAAVDDRIYIYRNNQYVRLHWDGTEWRNGANLATESLNSGEGFWFLRRQAGNLTWDLQ